MERAYAVMTSREDLDQSPSINSLHRTYDGATRTAELRSRMEVETMRRHTAEGEHLVIDRENGEWSVYIMTVNPEGMQQREYTVCRIWIRELRVSE